MELISLYLEKFKNIGLPEKQLKEVVQSAIKEVVGVTIDVSKITLDAERGLVKVSGHPALKSELFLKKEGLEKILAERSKIKKIR